MEERYPCIKNNPWLKASLVLNTGVSNCPDHFYETIGRLLKDPSMLDCGCLNEPIEPIDHFSFNYALYLAVWREKERKDLPYTATPRHQPTHNRRATEQQWTNSLMCLM